MAEHIKYPVGLRFTFGKESSVPKGTIGRITEVEDGDPDDEYGYGYAASIKGKKGNRIVTVCNHQMEVSDEDVQEYLESNKITAPEFGDRTNESVPEDYYAKRLVKRLGRKADDRTKPAGPRKSDRVRVYGPDEFYPSAYSDQEDEGDSSPVADSGDSTPGPAISPDAASRDKPFHPVGRNVRYIERQFGTTPYGSETSYPRIRNGRVDAVDPETGKHTVRFGDGSTRELDYGHLGDIDEIREATMRELGHCETEACNVADLSNYPLYSEDNPTRRAGKNVNRMQKLLEVQAKQIHVLCRMMKSLFKA